MIFLGSSFNNFLFSISCFSNYSFRSINFDDIEFIKPHIKILSVSKVGAGYVSIHNKSKFAFSSQKLIHLFLSI